VSSLTRTRLIAAVLGFSLAACSLLPRLASTPTPTPTQVQPTSPPTITPRPTPIPSPTLYPIPTAFLGEAPFPSSEQSAGDFLKKISPLLERLDAAQAIPQGLELPPESDWQVQLVPATKPLYYAQTLLLPAAASVSTAGAPRLYALYDMQCGKGLGFSQFGLPVFSASTQELTVKLRLALELDGKLYWIDEDQGVGGEGAGSLGELVHKAVHTAFYHHQEPVYEPTQRSLQTILEYMIGLDVANESALPRRLALLENTLSYPCQQYREQAVYALGYLGAPAASSIPVLINLLSDDNKDLVKQAADSISKIQPGIITTAEIGQVGLLTQALNAESWERRAAAARLLGRLDREDMENALQALLPALGDTDARVRLAVVEAFQEYMFYGDQRILQALPPLLGDPDEAVRQAAAWSIRHVGEKSPEIVPLLLPTLHDASPKVRLQALEALHRMDKGADSAYPEVLKLLNDPDETVRARVLQFLAYIRPEANETKDALLAAIKSGSHPERVQAIISSFTSQIQDPRLEPALIEMMSNPYPEIRIHTTYALGAITGASDQVIPPLIHALKDENLHVRARAAHSLVARHVHEQYGTRAEIIPLLINLLSDVSQEVRQAAYQELKSITEQDFGEDSEKWSAWWNSQS
jgi:HEAT repeat protein